MKSFQTADLFLRPVVLGGSIVVVFRTTGGEANKSVAQIDHPF